MSSKKRIGILGGTFNPIHIAHLVLAEEAKDALKLEKVFFIPTNLPSHKNTKGLISAKIRSQMISLAIRSNPHFELCDIELKRGGISHSIETVKALTSSLQNAKLYFLVGSDFVKEYLRWKDIGALRKLCTFVVAQRPGSVSKRIPRHMRTLKISPLDISSSVIRKRISRGRSIRYLVPEAVEQYILKNGLYRVF